MDIFLAFITKLSRWAASVDLGKTDPLAVVGFVQPAFIYPNSPYFPLALAPLPGFFLDCHTLTLR
jgi:hypothetical protein